MAELSEWATRGDANPALGAIRADAATLNELRWLVRVIESRMQTAAVDAVREGVRVTSVARAARVSRPTLYEWIGQRDPEAAEPDQLTLSDASG